MFKEEELVENILLIIHNITKFYSNEEEDYLKLSNQNDLDAGIIFFYFINPNSVFFLFPPVFIALISLGGILIS